MKPVRFVVIGGLVLSAAACGRSDSGPTTPSSPTPAPPTTTWRLTGTVTEVGSDRPVSGARVRVADGPNATQSATTNALGGFTLPNLAQGGFTVIASNEAYADDAKGVTLDGHKSLTFQLRRIGFGAGQYLVGSEMPAARYFTDPPLIGCAWERQSGLSGTLGETIAHASVDFDAFQLIVDILPSDLVFETQPSCGVWYRGPLYDAQSSIRPGAWLVGSQVTPGTYQVNATPGCYWERLRGFGGTLSDIIANDFVSGGGQQLVEIRGSDVGFYTDADCGTWTPTDQATAGITSATASAADTERNRRLNRQQSGAPPAPR